MTEIEHTVEGVQVCRSRWGCVILGQHLGNAGRSAIAHTRCLSLLLCLCLCLSLCLSLSLSLSLSVSLVGQPL